MRAQLCFCIAVFLLFVSQGAAGRRVVRKIHSSQPTISDSQLQDCILRDINCPPNGVLDFKQARIFIRILNSLDLPERCKCDLSVDQCLRGCYYNYQLKAAVMTAVWQALREGTDVDAAKQSSVVSMETYFKPCLLEGKGCEELRVSLDSAKLNEGLANFKALVDLPEQCLCNIEEDACARSCFYAEVKKLIPAGLLQI